MGATSDCWGRDRLQHGYRSLPQTEALLLGASYSPTFPEFLRGSLPKCREALARHCVGDAPTNGHKKPFCESGAYPYEHVFAGGRAVLLHVSSGWSRQWRPLVACYPSCLLDLQGVADTAFLLNACNLFSSGTGCASRTNAFATGNRYSYFLPGGGYGCGSGGEHQRSASFRLKLLSTLFRASLSKKDQPLGALQISPASLLEVWVFGGNLNPGRPV